MEVSQYTFRSPYPNPVQIGQADTSKAKTSEQNQEAEVQKTKSQELEKENPVNGITNAQQAAKNETAKKLLDVYA